MASSSNIVLVTGSKGFIGQYLVKELLKSFEVVEWTEDIKNLSKLNKRVQTVFHLAGVTSKRDKSLDHYELFDSNVWVY